MWRSANLVDLLTNIDVDMENGSGVSRAYGDGGSGGLVEEMAVMNSNYLSMTRRLEEIFNDAAITKVFRH